MSTEFKPQVDPSHYADLTYDSKERFISYWHQIHEVVDTAPESVVEIGIGNGFVHKSLRDLGVSVHTVDADSRLGPDTVASVTDLPFKKGEFDVCCCFETLEHLPWDQFEPALSELRRVTRRYVLLSLPDVTLYIKADVSWGLHKRLVSLFTQLPRLRPEIHQFNGEHYWEIGKRDYPQKRISDAFARCHLVLERQFRVREYPYHHFFRLKVTT